MEPINKFEIKCETKILTLSSKSLTIKTKELKKCPQFFLLKLETDF